MSTRPRQRLSKEESRRRIVAAAVEMIGVRGFRAFSIKELAQVCGMTDAGILFHFGSKVGLLMAVLDERDRRDRIFIAETLTHSTEPRPHSLEEFGAILIALVLRNQSSPEFIRLFAMLRVEALAPDHPARDYFVRRDAEALRSYTAMLPVDLPDRVGFARQLIVGLDGLELQWLREGRSFDLVAEWRKLSDKLFQQPGGDPAQASCTEPAKPNRFTGVAAPPD